MFQVIVTEGSKESFCKDLLSFCVDRAYKVDEGILDLNVIVLVKAYNSRIATGNASAV